MKQETIKWIMVVIVFGYAVTFLERMVWNNTTEIQNDAYKEEKSKYENTIQELNNKLYEHEINLIMRNVNVDNYTNVELDEQWAELFR